MRLRMAYFPIVFYSYKNKGFTLYLPNIVYMTHFCYYLID